MRVRALAGVVLGLIVVGPTADAQDQPTRTELEETVEVNLIQVEVTAWPKHGDATTCRELQADDFELLIGGKPRRIDAVDWLGVTVIEPTPGQVQPQEDEPEPVRSGQRSPLTLVLYFDLWHLNLFVGDYSCPLTKPLAFDEARRMVREQFRPGDRLLLVTFAGWPRIHEGWIRDREHALAALDRLEVSPVVVSAQQRHSHHHAWIDGMKSLMLALGRYPGAKEVIYLGDDFRFDDVALRIFDLAARAQANQVTVHAVDLLWTCRRVPGPGCPGRRSTGGLLCTPFSNPIALGPISSNTGGRFFTNADLSAAVGQLREMRGCRFLVSFAAEGGETHNKSPQFRILLKRKGFYLRAPISFQNPDRPPKEREELDALFLLPRFGEGLIAEAGLWPLRPMAKKKKRWKALLLAKLRRSPNEPWDDSVTELVLDAAVLKGSRTYGKFRKILEGSELRSLRDDGESRLFVFSVEGVRPGEATIAFRAQARGAGMSANFRSEFFVPEPPEAGQARPWFLADSFARVGDDLTLVPSLDGVVAEGTQPTILGYGCRGDDGPLPDGSLRGLDRELSIPVAIEWLDQSDIPERPCGWLVGRIRQVVPAGVWRFEPPTSLGPPDEASPVDFLVIPPQSR